MSDLLSLSNNCPFEYNRIENVLSLEQSPFVLRLEPLKKERKKSGGDEESERRVGLPDSIIKYHLLPFLPSI